MGRLGIRFFSALIFRLKMPVGHCIECDKAINRGANLTEYKGFTYHTNCFVCQICTKNITGPQGFINDPVDAKKHYCHDCHLDKFAERCSLDSCKKPIPPGTQFLVVDADKFHKDCFNCSGCEKNLADEAFVKDPEGNFCAVCADI